MFPNFARFVACRHICVIQVAGASYLMANFLIIGWARVAGVPVGDVPSTTVTIVPIVVPFYFV